MKRAIINLASSTALALLFLSMANIAQAGEAGQGFMTKNGAAALEQCLYQYDAQTCFSGELEDIESYCNQNDCRKECKNILKAEGKNPMMKNMRAFGAELIAVDLHGSSATAEIIN